MYCDPLNSLEFNAEIMITELQHKTRIIQGFWWVGNWLSGGGSKKEFDDVLTSLEEEYISKGCFMRF